MAIQQKEVTVKGSTYMMTHFPALRGTRILKQLVKLIGPAFTQLQTTGNVSDAMNMLFDNMSDDVELLIPELISTCSKSNGMALNYDAEFAGEYDKMFLLAKEVVMFNFGSVFTLLGSDVQ